MHGRIAAYWLACSLAAAANAEIFKCVSASGDVRFTSNASDCPNAAPHAPKEGALQRVEKKPAPLASARPGARASARRSGAAAQAAAAEASEASWRNKKAGAERRVSELEDAHSKMLAAVKWCNEGFEITTKDRRTGLRQDVACEDVHAERALIESELALARAYLAEGLEDECRQAGCLPGWIR